MPQQQASRWIKTTCPYCGTGCGVDARVDGEGKVQIRGDQSHPTNSGLLCSKGTALADTLINDGRLLHAQIKGRKESLEKSLSYVAARLNQTLSEHGPDSVAFYVSGQLLTEDYYVANKLMKGFIGSSNIDSNSRLCMSSAVAGHKRAFGTDTVPGCYDDLELAELVTLVGSNLAWCHPILFQRLKKAKQVNPELKVVVIDPRRTDSCDISDLHLAIEPGTDVAFFNGLLRYLAEHKQLDREYIAQYCDGFDVALSSAKSDFSSYDAIAGLCGLSESELLTFYRKFATTERCVTVFSQGVNQSSRGVDKVNAIINCHLATGKIGKPGATPFSITGQPNAMGGREVGGLANMLAAHLEFTPEHMAAVSDFWNSENLSSGAGAKAIEMFDKVANGEIKAIWIMGTNPAVSLPRSANVREALLACPFVVVSDCIENTDTTRFADVLLPAAGWGEKSGSVTNAERRISRQRRFLPALADARPDWWLLSEVAKRMGFAEAFNYRDESEVFAEHARMTGLLQDVSPRDLDISALGELDKTQYDQLQPVMWPIKAKLDPRRFFTRGQFYTPNGRAQFIALTYTRAATHRSKRYPYILNSGRVRDQWHSMTRTGLASVLSSHICEPLLEIHPQDAQSLALTERDIVEVHSAVGATKARVTISKAQKPGCLFMPIHWSDQYASDGVVSRLVTPEFDAISGQPESKYTPVALQAWSYQTEAILLSVEPLTELPANYWVKQKLEQGYLYHLAAELAPAEFAIQLTRYFNELIEPQFLDYSHPAKQLFRRGIVSQGQLVASFCVMTKGELNQQSWLETLLSQPLSDNVLRGVLSGTSPAPDLGKIVCSCHQVREKTIKEVITAQQLTTIEQVGSSCKAGTNCGSCVPELKRIINQLSVKVV